MRGHILLRSVKPLPKDKLKIFSIGGYSATSRDGRKFRFDWDDMSANAHNDEEGHLIIECDLRYFNMDDYMESNLENHVDMNKITPNFIVNSKLTEIYYEAFEDDVDGTLIAFDVLEFGISIWNETLQEFVSYDFEESKLKEFNEKYASYKDYLKPGYKEFKIPVTWEAYGVVTVEAKSLEEALTIVIEDSDDIPLPTESHYVDGSFRPTTEDLDDLKLITGQKDEIDDFIKTKLTVEQQFKLIGAFYELYYSTAQDTDDFAVEFYNVIGNIFNNYIPKNLDHLIDFESVIEDILKEGENHE